MLILGKEMGSMENTWLSQRRGNSIGFADVLGSGGFGALMINLEGARVGLTSMGRGSEEESVAREV